MRRWESGKQVDFRDLNLVTRGSEIQRACYDYLLATEAGCFVSYCEIARAIARPKASRAVAHACAINPLPLFVPCHRVIPAQAARRIASGKSAHYGNYAYGAALKRALIEFEAGSR
ncbi:MAG: methylated-DNA--[protein]-cysteine S-methyltransferase [Arcanobacterium sp.]|nr:methylated-DNA--[protein]-cysteine S-methyltransferase [Arcanobacterium sp.]